MNLYRVNANGVEMIMQLNDADAERFNAVLVSTDETTPLTPPLEGGEGTSADEDQAPAAKSRRVSNKAR